MKNVITISREFGSGGHTVGEQIAEKLGYKFYDKEIIETVRSVTNLPIAIDANQGWKDKHQALDMIVWLKEKLRGNILYMWRTRKAVLG